MTTQDHRMTAADVKVALMQYRDAEKAEVLPRFFKIGAGEYGEGDVFMGVAVPDVRKVAKLCKDAPQTLISELMASEVHECRACALFILSERFKRSKSEDERREIYDYYLAHTARVNNWDLVDCSCHIIVGGHLMDKPRDVLYRLMDHPLLWNKRIAVVSCLAFIRHNDFRDIFRLTERLLATAARPHDLMQKACGWMLREVGKHGGMEQLEAFLDRHAATMPRTMLRYAIERMDTDERRHYLMARTAN